MIPLEPDELAAAADEVHACLDSRRRVVFSLFLAAAPRLWRLAEDGIVLDLAACVRSGLDPEPHAVFDRVIGSMYSRSHGAGVVYPYGPAVGAWLAAHRYLPD